MNYDNILWNAIIVVVFAIAISVIVNLVNKQERRIAKLEATSTRQPQTTVSAQAPAVLPSPQAASTQKPDTYWRLNKNAPSWETEWELIGDDQYVYAVVRKSSFDSSWSIFHNGAGFGEFATEQAAKAEAEAVARRLGRKTV